MDNKYWAAESEENIGSEVIERFKKFGQYLSDTGDLQVIRKSYKTYYGSHEIKDISNSLKAIQVNNYASLIRNLHVMVTSSRPAWQPRAINSDLSAQASAELGNSLLEYYMREKDLENIINKATEYALVLKEGWVVCDWDVNAGDIISTDENEKPIFQGDIDVKVYHILDVARDIYKKGSDNNKWFIVRDYVNKYDLANTYEDLAEKILSISEDSDAIENELNQWNRLREKYYENDLIPVYKLYHDKTPTLPAGRLVTVVDKDCVLFDGPLPYRKPYVFKISATNKADLNIGHSYMSDLLPLQDAMNMTFSSIVTNMAANAVQNFQMPKGSGIKSNTLSDGMKILEYDPKVGKIEPLDLLKTAPEVYNFTTMINDYMQLLSNVSSISRGEAPASMSGTAMALLQQNSIQFNNGLQLSHIKLLENVGTAIIELLKEFAEHPRMAIIVGKNKTPQLKAFSNKDLQGISGVIVDSANPLTKTSAGRVEIANQLLATQGMIKTPEQYLGVLTTGNLEPLYEFDRSRQYVTKAENEAMLEGKEVEVLLTDDHSIHVLEHSCILNNLSARKDPNIVAGVLKHIQEHINIAQTMSPEMSAMLKQTSFTKAPQAPPQMQGNVEMNPNIGPDQTPLEQQVGGINLPSPAESPLPPLA